MRSRRPFSALLPTLTLLPALVVPLVSLQAQSFDDVEIEVIPVADGVAMLVGRGGNIGVSYGEDGVFLVDDQYAPLTDRIVAAVRTLSEEPIRFVLNTHWHGDHTGGNEPLGKAGALIVAHDNVRERLSTEQMIEFFGRRVPPVPAAALPVVTFTDAVTFHWNGDEIHAFHVPRAHTDGDAIVHFRRADVTHTGDLVFAGRYPFIDLSSGGSVDGLIAAVRRIVELAGPGTRIIPGHGPLTDRDHVASYLAMIETVRARIAALLAQGLEIDAIVEVGPTAEFDEAWGGGFVDGEALTRIVAESLQRRR